MEQLNDKYIKEYICEIGKRLYNKNLVCASGGNISVKCGENEFWCTPSGVHKGFMDESMIVKVNLNGELIEGVKKPSSEMKMHLRVYKENEEVNAVVHAHPPVATSFSIAKIPLDAPILIETLMFLGNVPVAKYATPGTYEVPESISLYCKDHNAVLLANHGALTWGRTLDEAFFRMEMLEQYASIIIHTAKITDKPNLLNTEQVNKLIAIRNGMGIKGGGIPRFEE